MHQVFYGISADITANSRAGDVSFHSYVIVTFAQQYPFERKLL